ncbi:MAG: YkvA family protein [Beijerinckiaceae bacterium]
MTALLAKAKGWARTIKRDILALWLAARDARTPFHAKAIAAAVAAYALSPIDLIPDFIPVLGYLDDLLIVPLGILLAVKLIPADVIADLRRRAETIAARPVSRGGIVFVVAVWIAAAGWLAWMLLPLLR